MNLSAPDFGHEVRFGMDTIANMGVFRVRKMDRVNVSTRREDGQEPRFESHERTYEPRVSPSSANSNKAIAAVPRWVDDRLTLAKGGKTFLNKIFPDHWSFMLGEISLYSFIILLATGVYLTFFFVPSGHMVLYHGPYKPLWGQHVSEAYMSTVNLSLDTRFGLLMRQMHHWAADIFIAAAVVHMCRVFFTGAFRRPREINWMIGLTLMLLAIVNGFLGYSIPDDLVSGTGLRIAFSIFESIPIVGNWLGYAVFGGPYPGNGDVIFRFYIAHVLILPLLILGLIGAHMGMMVYQKHTQFPGPGRTNKNVVGAPMFPTFMAKTTGYFFVIVGVIALMGALFQINPIWLYGQYIPYKVSYAVQPDWYMGWLDGALRIMPSWELHLPGHMIPNVFFPAVLFPGLTFNILYAWPFIERKFSKAPDIEHHLLDRPRDNPKRTGLGVGVLTFYFMLFGASSTDVLANMFHVSLNTVLWFFRFAVFIVPVIVGFAAFQLAHEMKEGPQDLGKRKRHNIVVRSAQGGYSTIPVEGRPGDGHGEPEPEVLNPEVLHPEVLHPEVLGEPLHADLPL